MLTRAFLKDGDAILSGYRAGMGFKGTCLSIFRLHNETINVWSHLLGAVFFLYLSLNLQHHISVPLLRNSLHDAMYAGQPYVVAEGMCFQNTSDMRGHMYRLHSEMDLLDPIWWTEVTTVARSACMSMERFPISVHPLADNMRNKFKNMREHAVALRAQLSTQLRHDYRNTTTQLIAAFGNLEHRLSKKAMLLGDKSRRSLEELSKRMVKMRGALKTQMSAAVASWKDSLPGSPTDAFVDRTFSIKGFLTLSKRVKQKLLALETDFQKNASTWQPPALSNELPFWPTFWFLGSAMVCMLFSATFHLLAPVNISLFQFLQKLDYAGISILISGSGVPIAFYSFRCTRWIAILFVCLNTLVNLVGGVIMMLPRFGTPETAVRN